MCSMLNSIYVLLFHKDHNAIMIVFIYFFMILFEMCSLTIIVFMYLS